jgi:hypothetical protein
MGLVLRSTKGSALTIEELDGNFTYLSSQPAITGSLTVAADNTGEVTMNVTGSNVLFPQLPTNLYFTNDVSASAAGVPVGGIYLWWDGNPSTTRYLTVRVV